MIQTIENKLSPERFIYWLQGFLEIEEPKDLTEKQLNIIKDHLNLVFNKVTPNYTQTTSTNNNIKYCTASPFPNSTNTFIC